VNDVNRCYKLKLFLQQFYISAAVLNSEVPANSRQHILDEFNKGVFDYLIATDASIDGGADDLGDDEEDEGDEENAEADEEEGDEGDDEEDEIDSEEDEEDFDVESEEEEEPVVASKKRKGGDKLPESSNPKKRAAISEDEAYGVARGIDFQGVNFVINFDFPVSAAAYTHRIGRTARGGATGTALSFVTAVPTTVIASNYTERTIAVRDNAVLRQVQSQQPWIGSSGLTDDNLATMQQDGTTSDESRMQPAPLQFNMKELDTFRYRVEDIIRGVTTAAVKEYRTAELKKEILHSQKLKAFFAENPNDLKVLRHDQSVAHPIKQKHHLKHVPNYLVPVSMRSMADSNSGRKPRRRNNNISTEKKIQKSKMRDPLVAATAGATADEAEGNDNDANEMEAPEMESVGLGKSKASGRSQWQQRHHKGQFSNKKRENENKLPGSFSTLRKFKK
jgi:ATP-dependent RNA helicase DDX56/DBP9